MIDGVGAVVGLGGDTVMTQNGKVCRFLPRLFWVGSLLPQQRTNSGRISLAFSLFVANPRMGSRFRLSAALPFAWESSLGGLGLQHECDLGGRNFLPRLRPPILISFCGPSCINSARMPYWERSTSAMNLVA